MIELVGCVLLISNCTLFVMLALLHAVSVCWEHLIDIEETKRKF